MDWSNLLLFHKYVFDKLNYIEFQFGNIDLENTFKPIITIFEKVELVGCDYMYIVPQNISW